jgi:hypothetical protein
MPGTLIPHVEAATESLSIEELAERDRRDWTTKAFDVG